MTKFLWSWRTIFGENHAWIILLIRVVQNKQLSITEITYSKSPNHFSLWLLVEGKVTTSFFDQRKDKAVEQAKIRKRERERSDLLRAVSTTDRKTSSSSDERIEELWGWCFRRLRKALDQSNRLYFVLTVLYMRVSIYGRKIFERDRVRIIY